MRTRKCAVLCTLLICMGMMLAPALAQTPQAKPPTQDKINLNTATAEQLQALPGIGPALAERIITYRAKVGKFTKVEEILNVTGVGEKMFQRLKDRLSV
ncbi:MAG: ComEA family DNA-binding protein [Acidobacteriota bacterium]